MLPLDWCLRREFVSIVLPALEVDDFSFISRLSSAADSWEQKFFNDQHFSMTLTK